MGRVFSATTAPKLMVWAVSAFVAKTPDPLVARVSHIHLFDYLDDISKTLSAIALITSFFIFKI
jgi:hypothetical protein